MLNVMQDVNEHFRASSLGDERADFFGRQAKD